MAYRVFGCDGSANDDVIIDAIEMAVADGADVINMSLGSEWGDGKGLSEKAVDNASKAGVVMVISAGNAGSGAYLVGGPGTADRAISVAAVDAGFPSYDGVLAEDVANIEADVPLVVTNGNTTGIPISGDVLLLGLGCDETEYDPEAVGKIRHGPTATA